jgi:hypothetical protein
MTKSGINEELLLDRQESKLNSATFTVHSQYRVKLYLLSGFGDNGQNYEDNIIHGRSFRVFCAKSA